MTTNKQKAFIEEYLKDFNATQAAIRAGYSDASARVTGHRLLTNANISAAIQDRLDELHMSAEEALKLLSDIARGDMADFMDPDTLILDIRKAKKDGKTRLIKKLKQRTVTKLGKNESDKDVEIHDMEIELYGANAAIRDILKVHGKFTDKVDITSKGEKLESGIDELRDTILSKLDSIATARSADEADPSADGN